MVASSLALVSLGPSALNYQVLTSRSPPRPRQRKGAPVDAEAPCGRSVTENLLQPSELLNGLAVQCEVEAVAFDFLADPQADHQIDDFENDQRHDDVVDEDDANADALIDHLAPIAFDGARGAAIFADGKDAGEDRAGRAADGVDAKCVERVVIAERVLAPGTAPVADDAGGDADGEGAHRTDKARRRRDGDQSRDRARANAEHRRLAAHHPFH